jgi:sulfide:quinone oxidoreductase
VSEKPGRYRPHVLIAGGGVAALEAALALREFAGDRLEVELCSPRGEFVYRPFAVSEPYGTASILRYGLAELTERIGVSFRPGGLFSADVAMAVATARDGEEIPYDFLLVACGARMLWAVPGSVTFWGVSDEGGFGALVRRLRSGALRDMVFTMPRGNSWGLPLYELALLASSVLAKSGIEDARLTVVTPEDAPLELFGRAVGGQMAALLGERGIEVVTGACPVAFEDGRLRIAPGDPIETEAVVSLPRLEGRRIDGLPADADGFLPIDGHCRVVAADGVFAAGDVTAFPVKQGGIATQAADAAAAAIAAEAGCELDPVPLDPVLRSPGPDGRIAGRYLGPFLATMPDGEQPLLAAR